MAKKIVGAAFLSLCVIFLFAAYVCPTTAEGRVLAGSKTEKKLNKKVQSLLKAARKQNKSGKIQGALDTYWKTLELDPTQGPAYLELGEIYVGLKIYNRAIELLEPGIEYSLGKADTDTICYYYCLLARVYQAVSNSGKANQALIKAAQASPKNPMTREVLGDIYFANNRIADAMKAYKKALDFDPSYTPAKTKLDNLIAEYGAIPPPKKRLSKKALTIAAKAVKENSETKKITKTAAKTPNKLKADKKTPESGDTAKVSGILPMPNVIAANKTPKKAKTAAEDIQDKKARARAAAHAAADEEAHAATGAEAHAAADEEAHAAAGAEAHAAADEEAHAAANAEAAADAEAAANAEAAAGEALNKKPTEEEIQAQINKLLAGSEAEKEAAADFFAAMKKDGLAEVEELIYDPLPEVRVIAIRALLRFKNDFEQHVADIYKDALDDPSPMVQEELKRAIGEL